MNGEDTKGGELTTVCECGGGGDSHHNASYYKHRRDHHAINTSLLMESHLGPNHYLLQLRNMHRSGKLTIWMSTRLYCIGQFYSGQWVPEFTS